MRKIEKQRSKKEEIDLDILWIKIVCIIKRNMWMRKIHDFDNVSHFYYESHCYYIPIMVKKIILSLCSYTKSLKQIINQNSQFSFFVF